MNASHLNLIARATEEAVDGLNDLSNTDAGRSFGETAKDVLTNRYVLGGLAAVAVAGAAYGTYRFIKSRQDKKGSTTSAAAPAATDDKALTVEQMIAKARGLLADAESSIKKNTPAAVEAPAEKQKVAA
jgi:uncharacterized membrane protein YebE (DUF533 family)